MQINCFEMIGIKREEFVKHRKVENILSVLKIGLMSFCIFSQALFVVRNFRDILASAEACGPLLTTVLAVAKIITFMVSKKKFFQMMDQVKLLSAGGEFEKY